MIVSWLQKGYKKLKNTAKITIFEKCDNTTPENMPLAT